MQIGQIRGDYVQQGLRFNRILKRPERLLSLAVKVVIVFLCLYIGSRCINILTGKNVQNSLAEVGGKATKVIARELMDTDDIYNQYQLIIENNQTLDKEAKKHLLELIADNYLAHSEYTYDTNDPNYNDIINLMYENVSSTKNTPKETTNKKTNKREVKASNKIVPMPKSVGKKYTVDNIGSFKSVMEKFYVVTAATAVYSSDLPLDKALGYNFQVKGKNSKPQILIYHTHSQEEISNSTSDKETTIIGVGTRLAEILKKQFGYNVIHDTSTYDIVNGQLDRNEAYDQAGKGVSALLKKYPSISLVIDVHRDGVGTSTRLVTNVNGKSTAQIMFLNGMSRFKTTGDIAYLHNPYRFENLALALQMKLKAEEYYPGFTRHNYVNAYEYNLNMCKQSMLVEVGAQTNTYQEAKNAAEPLAMLIDMVLGKK